MHLTPAGSLGDHDRKLDRGTQPPRSFHQAAPIVAISRIGNPGTEQAVAELLTLARSPS
jgi:hypothetical protein